MFPFVSGHITWTAGKGTGATRCGSVASCVPDAGGTLLPMLTAWHRAALVVWLVPCVQRKFPQLTGICYLPKGCMAQAEVNRLWGREVWHLEGLSCNCSGGKETHLWMPW